MNSIENTDNNTRIAWQENWKDISVDTIMGVFEYERVKEMLATYKSFIKKGDKIIEAGCGLGPWVIKLSKEGYDITGVDYDPVSLEKIKAYDGSQKVFLSDIRKMPFNDGSFDVYLSFGVIEHFAEGPDEALKEAYRVLRHGGRAVITVPYYNLFVRLKAPLEYMKSNETIRAFFGKGKKLSYYQRFFKVNELRARVENAGFKIEKIAPIDHIFSLVSFSSIFRDKRSYDGENDLAISAAKILKRVLPWASADSTMVVAKK